MVGVVFSDMHAAVDVVSRVLRRTSTHSTYSVPSLIGIIVAKSILDQSYESAAFDVFSQRQTLRV